MIETLRIWLHLLSFNLFVVISLKYATLLTILRETIEGYLDSVSSLTFNTIKTKLIMHEFHSSRYLQSK